MNISTVKQYSTHTMNQRRLSRPEFGQNLSSITDVAALKQEISEILEKNGRIYGIYKKKELVGVYIFEKQEEYFVKRESSVMLGDKEFDYEKFWYGTGSAAFRFKKSVCLDEVKECIEKIEKDIRFDLQEQIEWGQVAGVEWNEELMYRKNLEKKPSNSLWGYGVGYVIGFVMGWLIFDSIPLGLSFGLMYACMWGGISVTTARGSEIATLDFVKKEEVKEDATT